MWPPRANPKVTAGLTWPPEMLAPTETATKSAKPWQIATASNPAGSSAASDVNLPANKEKEKSNMLKLKKHDDFIVFVNFYMVTIQNKSLITNYKAKKKTLLHHFSFISRVI